MVVIPLFALWLLVCGGALVLLPVRSCSVRRGTVASLICCAIGAALLWLARAESGPGQLVAWQFAPGAFPLAVLLVLQVGLVGMVWPWPEPGKPGQFGWLLIASSSAACASAATDLLQLVLLSALARVAGHGLAGAHRKTSGGETAGVGGQPVWSTADQFTLVGHWPLVMGLVAIGLFSLLGGTIVADSLCNNLAELYLTKASGEAVAWPSLLGQAALLLWLAACWPGCSGKLAHAATETFPELTTQVVLGGVDLIFRVASTGLVVFAVGPVYGSALATMLCLLALAGWVWGLLLSTREAAWTTLIPLGFLLTQGWCALGQAARAWQLGADGTFGWELLVQNPVGPPAAGAMVLPPAVVLLCGGVVLANWSVLLLPGLRHTAPGFPWRMQDVAGWGERQPLLVAGWLMATAALCGLPLTSGWWGRVLVALEAAQPVAMAGLDLQTSWPLLMTLLFGACLSVISLRLWFELGWTFVIEPVRRWPGLHSTMVDWGLWWLVLLPMLLAGLQPGWLELWTR